MKTQNLPSNSTPSRLSRNALSCAALASFISIAATQVSAQPITGYDRGEKVTVEQARDAEHPNAPTFWGFGVGLVFSSIPISEAEFAAPFTQLYYSWYITDPNAHLRTALSLGLYGFGMVLPVPKVSAEMFIGKPTRDIQGKLGVGGFYDIAVGGHGGLSLETGIRIANRYDISFVTVPFGSDSKRDYADFLGLRSQDEPPAKEPFVRLPYFGIFTSVAF